MSIWTIDQAHSEIGFSVIHLMVSKVKGHFSVFSGSITTTNDTLVDSRIVFEAESASVTTGNEKRDGHLKSADFFDVVKFSKITFISTSFNKKLDSNFELTGDFTMHGITKSITLDVVVAGPTKDSSGKRVMGFTLSGALHRSDFGLMWNLPIEAGGVMVSDEVKLNIDVEAIES